jgi:S1-C subfamily serine protease
VQIFASVEKKSLRFTGGWDKKEKICTVSTLRFLALIAVLLLVPVPASSRFITDAEEFSFSTGVAFSWAHARSRSVKIILEYRDKENTWRRVNLGSGFLLSPDGLFVTAYHVMKYCLAAQRETSGLSVQIDCSSHPNVRYVAVNDDREFPIEIIAHLKESESTRGKDHHSPDEIIKQRDFVVGRIKAEPAQKFSFWRLRDFDQTSVDVSNPAADFNLTPLFPPKQVFIAGFPSGHDFVISQGYLNLTEKNRRGYFAADLNVYTPPYLEDQGLAKNTRWGLRVENHMSGGAVVDSAGYVVGMVVNGDGKTAGVLSIENLLATFFSRAGSSGAQPAVLLNPTNTPLFLKQNARRDAVLERKAEPALLSQSPKVSIAPPVLVREP